MSESKGAIISFMHAIGELQENVLTASSAIT
jgi:hypothetical protein